MAKRKRGFDESTYKEWVEMGRGRGVGKDYIPWLTTYDVSSLGRVARPKGIVTDRIHYFLSDKENNYFHILDYCYDSVIDIREQFPLSIEQTMAIAEEINVEHPKDPKTKIPIVMTTDFLITIKVGGRNVDIARTVKSEDDLRKKRTIEKFEIERRYWKLKGIDWGIITDDEKYQVFGRNVSYIHSFFTLENISGLNVLSDKTRESLTEAFLHELEGVVIVREKARAFEEKMQLEPGTAISIFKHLLIRKRITFDLTTKLDLDNPQEIKIRF